jgi:phage pi2 protein 07
MVCIGIRKGISVVTGGYVYMPFDPNKAYFSYNIEQQAELVSDRFRLALGLGTYDTRNNGAQYSQLNNVVPFH